VNVAKIQEAVTNELKKDHKDEFSAAFQNLHNRTKAFIFIYTPMELILNKKLYMSTSRVFNFHKKSVLKFLDSTVYEGMYISHVILGC